MAKVDLAILKSQLISKGYDQRKVSKSIAYLSSEIAKDKSPVHSNGQSDLYNLFVKYYNAGTNLDGTNVIVAGRNMGLITYHGYMNKVKAAHKGVFFDVQLVKKSDTFNFAKESGSVVYSHTIGAPFEDEEIVGAYCVVKLEDGNESLELLNARDYNEMKNASRSKSTWEKWPSEFWRKSVIKRACKVYFAEEVEALESIDNTDYGLEDEKASEETKNQIVENAKNKQ